MAVIQSGEMRSILILYRFENIWSQPVIRFGVKKKAFTRKGR